MTACSTDRRSEINQFPIQNVAQPETLQIAQQAFAAQQKGVATGDWSDFLALLGDDVEFRAPSPHLPNGVIYGKSAVAKLLQKFTTELNLKGKLTQTQSMVMNETTVAIEFVGEGQFGDEIVCHDLVVFYQFEQGTIKRFREYIGQI